LNRKWFGSYGVGDAVVVVSVVVLVSEVAGVAVSIGVAVAIGLIVAIGVDSAGLVAVVVVVLVSDEVVSDGEAAGVTVSVFCSQAARSAALARMQMYFFIRLWISAHDGVTIDSEQAMFSALLGFCVPRALPSPPQ
jgi:hypothetical protein